MANFTTENNTYYFRIGPAFLDTKPWLPIREPYLFGYATLTTHPPPYALSVYCILYVYMYIVFYRLLSKTHFRKLEQSPLNCSQKLPAPYKQLIDEIKQNYLRENDWRTDNLTDNRQLLTVTIDGSKRTNDITSLHSQ